MDYFRVLIVDSDNESARLMKTWIESHGKYFKCGIVSSGKLASEVLLKEKVSALITELILPDLDGFALLDFVNLHTPEIPVIVASAHGRPKTAEILARKGADFFIEKPLEVKRFLDVFDTVYAKVEEGGSLNGTSLDTFAQMIEMEQKTCTLRVSHPPSQGYGILFFKEGEIFHARIPGKVEGIEAAYEILAWQPVSLMIENRCKLDKQGIHADLQALLMEAMRLKDERLDDLKQEVKDQPDDEAEQIQELPVEEEAKKEDSLSVWMKTHKAQELGIDSIYQDAAWRDLLAYSKSIGVIFDTGDLSACYLNSGDGLESIILPYLDTVVTLSSSSRKEEIVDLLIKYPPVLS